MRLRVGVSRPRFERVGDRGQQNETDTTMKHVRWILRAVLVPALLAWVPTAVGAGGGAAQGGPGGQGAADASGSGGAGDSAGSPGKSDPGKTGKPENPGKPAALKNPEEGGPPGDNVVPDGNGMSLDVRRLVQEFREQQQQRLDEYRRLTAQARNAGAERRQQLREQLRQMLDEQQADRQRLREQIRERMQELTATLPSRKEVIDAAKEKARERQGRGRGE